MSKYVRYLLMPALMLVVGFGIMWGGAGMWFSLSALLIVMVGGDLTAGDDVSEPVFQRTWVLNAFLYASFPLLLSMLAAMAWMTGSGTSDFLGMGSIVQRYTGYDMFHARAATTWTDMAGGILAMGLAVAGYGTNIGHEFTHRTQDKVAMIVGRWLLAVSANADFSIEHVYGHHVHVGTSKDPATARRGESVYAFIIRSTIDGYKSAWNLEARRLARVGAPLFSVQNRALRGYAMTLAYLTAFTAAGGLSGAFVYILLAGWAKAVLEITNYFEHYGLIRVDGQRVMPRHSWNTNKRVSSIVLFSLTRHSAHHEKGDLPFWVLKPYPEAPTIPAGYLTTILIALLPPVWERMMRPRLVDWDKRFATKKEQKLALAANEIAGWADPKESSARSRNAGRISSGGPARLRVSRVARA